LVWGSKEFIYGPFVIQGWIYSLSAFFISFILFMMGVNAWHAHYMSIYEFNMPYLVFLWEMFVFVSMGALAGYFSSKKYLK
jgi:cell division protein FtsX